MKLARLQLKRAREAGSVVRELTRLVDSVTDRKLIPDVRLLIGSLQRYLGNFDFAKCEFSEAYRLYSELEDYYGAVRALDGVAFLLYTEGRLRQSLDSHKSP